VVNALVVVSVLANVVLLAVLWFKREARHYIDVMTEGERRSPRDTGRPEFRRFYGDRSTDVTGISGEGVVVEGVVFSDGWGITHWLDRPPMNEPKTEIWHRPWWRRRGPDPFTKISGHGGATKVVWIDKP
jgi:hypothetical protein